MRKLIEVSQDFDVVCDNPECDFKVKQDKTSSETDGKKWVNAPCPKCGMNLCTQTDYDVWVKMHRYINWINKWFSWLTIFIKKSKEPQIISAHVHDGIKVSEVKATNKL